MAVVRIQGVVRGPDLLTLSTAPLEAPGWKPDFSIVWDIRGLAVLDLVPGDLPQFGQTTEAMQPRLGPGKSAVLVRDLQDDVTVRLLAVRRRSNPDRHLRAFLDSHAAAEWLGVPVAAFDRPFDAPPHGAA